MRANLKELLYVFALAIASVGVFRLIFWLVPEVWAAVLLFAVAMVSGAVCVLWLTHKEWYRMLGWREGSPRFVKRKAKGED